MIPKEAVEEYKQLYKNRFGVEISDEEASFRANNLVSLYKVVYGDSSNPTDTLLYGCNRI